MHIFILIEDWVYDGYEILGAFAMAETARKAAQEEWDEQNKNPNEGNRELRWQERGEGNETALVQKYHEYRIERWEVV